MRVRAYLLVMILSVMPAVQLFAQKIAKQWEARYSEPGYTDEAAEQVETDANGNAFVLGTTDQDAILLKYDPSGKILWTFQAGRGVLIQRWGEPLSRDFVVDVNGNSYLALYGYTPSTESYSTAVIKIDANGKEIWRKNLSGYYDVPHVRLALVSDNSVAVFYRTSFTALALSCLSAAGDVLWTKKVNNPGEIQDVRFLNNNIVLNYSAGRYSPKQKAYLEVYNIDGTLAWGNVYQHEEKNSTKTVGLCYYNGELIVTYYVYAGSKTFNQVFRYHAGTGVTVGNFTIYMDYSFYSDSPMDVTAVGNDGEIMVVDADDLEARKYSLDGRLLWRKSFDMGSEYDYAILQTWPHPTTSSVDVLLRTRKLTTGGDTYSVTSFLPDKTSTVVANLSTARRDVVPVSFSESGSNVFIAGTFSNGNYLKDLTLTKLTTNVHAWTTAYNPVNSLTNVPTCVATDAQGNVYVAGMLWLDAGSSAFGVIKYDSTGKQVWVRKMAPDAKRGGGGSLSYTMTLAIAVTANQEVYISGVVDAGNMYNSSWKEEPRDLYTIKLDAGGNTVWTQKAASVLDDNYAGYQLALDSQNNLYVLGYDHNREVNGRMQMVLLKYDGSGAELWERRFGVYPDYLISGVPSDMPPVLKIFQDEAYVLYSGLYMLNSDYRDVVELRKFTSGGTETVVWQKLCSELDNGARESHARGSDLYQSADGTLHIAYSYYFEGRDIYGYVVVYDSEMRIQAVKPSGEKVWDKSWPVETGSVNRIALTGGGTQLYIFGITTTNFHYISAATGDGNELWYNMEPLTENRDYYGRRGFAFTKANGNALFASSDVTTVDGAAHYFVSERDQKTGVVIATETFDEVYDTYGTYYRPGDMLMGACLSADLQNLFITGSIQDKAIEAETMVTLKYSLTDTNDGNGGDDDGDDDDGDNDGNNPVTSNEPDAEQLLAAYPTLNRGVFQIRGLTRESSDIQVFDAFGLYVCRFDAAAEYFDLTGRPAGVYLIRIQHRGQWFTTKIMKE